MARYIDAEPLPNGQFWDNCTDTEKAKILTWILSQPTADVQEVVRCKDCVLYEEIEYYHPIDKNATKKICRLIKRQMHDNDYCSYGERKEEK